VLIRFRRALVRFKALALSNRNKTLIDIVKNIETFEIFYRLYLSLCLEKKQSQTNLELYASLKAFLLYYLSYLIKEKSDLLL
jgi:hypothetical protein